MLSMMLFYSYAYYVVLHHTTTSILCYSWDVRYYNMTAML
jgi:hypothetical protein